MYLRYEFDFDGQQMFYTTLLADQLCLKSLSCEDLPIQFKLFYFV